MLEVGAIVENMETDEINLMDIPNEILMQIFGNLDDSSLLRTTRVCKRFKAIAKDAFAKKYNGASTEKYYDLTVSSESFAEERKLYQPLLCVFGNNITAINIDFDRFSVIRVVVPSVVQNHWLILSIGRYCKSIKKAKVSNGHEIDLTNIIYFLRKLTHLCLQNLSLLNYKWTEYEYPKLLYFSATDVERMDNENFGKFINNNRQLQEIRLIRTLKTSKVLPILNGKLMQLTTLVLVGDEDEELFTNNDNILRMDNLMSLKVGIAANSFIHSLTTIKNGCKHIENLSISNCDYTLMDSKFVNALCSFDKLKKLELMDFFELSLELLQLLVRRMPKLVSFSLGNADNICENDDLLAVVSTCQKLLHLHLEVDPHLPLLNYEFYSRFTDILESNGSILKLELQVEHDKIVLTRDEGRFIHHESRGESVFHHSILYWKGYDAAYNRSNKNLLELKKNILTNITSYLDGNALYAFYQTCKQTKQLVKEHLSKNIFYGVVHPTKFTDTTVLMGFGQQILRMKVYMNGTDWISDDDFNQETFKFIKDVNKYCGRSLMELKMDYRIESVPSLSWPNLRKLNIYMIGNQTLREFRECSKLTHLELCYYGPHAINVAIDWTVSFRNVTSLTFWHYNGHVEKLLYGINETICSQLKEFSLMSSDNCNVENQRRRWINLHYIITRFGQLTGLHLYIKGIEESNYKFLFENCSKLVELSIFCDRINNQPFFEMFRHIKACCKEIKDINLIGKSSASKPLLEMVYSTIPKTNINLIDIEQQIHW